MWLPLQKFSGTLPVLLAACSACCSNRGLQPRWASHCLFLTAVLLDQNTPASTCPALQVTAVQYREAALGADALESCNFLVKAQVTLLPSFFVEADRLQVGDIGRPWMRTSCESASSLTATCSSFSFQCTALWLQGARDPDAIAMIVHLKAASRQTQDGAMQLSQASNVAVGSSQSTVAEPGSSPEWDAASMRRQRLATLRTDFQNIICPKGWSYEVEQPEGKLWCPPEPAAVSA